MTAMTVDTDEAGAEELNPLDEIRGSIQKAVDFAETWGKEYRSSIFDIAISRLLTGGIQPSNTRVHVARPGIGKSLSGESALFKLAQHLSVEPSALTRVVEIEEDGTIHIMGRATGEAKRELQLKYSAIYCYIKEKALGQQQVDIEELRHLCITMGCYDPANFTANFRRDSWLRESGAKGSRDKRYVASVRGLSEAEQLLRDMIQS
jgi:hypothetical protein